MFLDAIKGVVSGVVEEVEKIPRAVSVVVGGAEHFVGEAYSSVKSVIGDAYGGVKTVAYDAVDLAGKAEDKALSPFTSAIKSFSTPLLFIGGALGFYIVYEMSQTSRAALPYAPSIVESVGRVAPMFGI